jgi:hypothetical protein
LFLDADTNTDFPFLVLGRAQVFGSPPAVRRLRRAAAEAAAAAEDDCCWTPLPLDADEAVEDEVDEVVFWKTVLIVSQTPTPLSEIE